MSGDDRRVRFEQGRVVVGGSSPPIVTAPPVTHEHGPSKSQGPQHGQGLGVGLALLAVGGKPPGQQGAVPPAAPVYSNTAITPTPGSSAASLVVTLPTYSAGDLVVVQITGGMGFSDNTASAAGWTQQVSFHPANRNTNLIAVFTRRMTGSEGATVTFSFSGTVVGNSRPAATATTYTGPNAATPVEASTVTYSPAVSVGSFSLGPLTTTGPNRVLLAFGGWSTTLTTYPGTKRFESAQPQLGGGTVFLSLCEVAAGSAGSYTETGTLGQPNALGGACMIALEAA